MSDQELFAQGGSGLVVQPWPADKASCLNAHFGEKMGLENQHINQGAPLFVPAKIGTLAASGAGTQRPAGQGNELDFCIPVGHAVRRLTPTECERLQGFPDGWTDIPWRGKDHAPDGPRYKALGNSMAVPCMRWIGECLAKIELEGAHHARP